MLLIDMRTVHKTASRSRSASYSPEPKPRVTSNLVSFGGDYRLIAATTTHAPATSITSTVTPGTTPAVLGALLLPWLVLDSLRSFALSPFDVASTLGSIVTVFFDFVTTVVEYVSVCEGSTAPCASDERKTSATPGAGTGIWHVFAVVSQVMVWITSVPVRRPSAWKRPPYVCREGGGCWNVLEQKEAGACLPDSPK